MKTIPAAALGLLVAVIAMTLAACTPEEAKPNLETDAKPIPAATGTPAIGAATPVSAEISAPSQAAPAETAAEAAQRFADALVSGDLTALTLSFAPTGLNQARLLASQSGVEGAGTVTTANVQSAVKLPDPAPTWDIVLAISTADTDSSLLSRWRWFAGIGWRIIGLETGPR